MAGGIVTGHGVNSNEFSKRLKKYKKVLAIPKNIMYTTYCCGMIAVKREVAAR